MNFKWCRCGGGVGAQNCNSTWICKMPVKVYKIIMDHSPQGEDTNLVYHCGTSRQSWGTLSIGLRVELVLCSADYTHPGNSNQ